MHFQIKFIHSPFNSIVIFIAVYQVKNSDFAAFFENLAFSDSIDGLHETIAAETMTALLVDDTNLETKAESLVQAALNSGGKDNITIVTAERF